MCKKIYSKSSVDCFLSFDIFPTTLSGKSGCALLQVTGSGKMEVDHQTLVDVIYNTSDIITTDQPLKWHTLISSAHNKANVKLSPASRHGTLRSSTTSNIKYMKRLTKTRSPVPMARAIVNKSQKSQISSVTRQLQVQSNHPLSRSLQVHCNYSYRNTPSMLLPVSLSVVLYMLETKVPLATKRKISCTLITILHVRPPSELKDVYWKL